MVAGQCMRGVYYAEDSRTVTEDGARHVISAFARHYLADQQDAPSLSPERARIDENEGLTIPQVVFGDTSVERAKVEAYLSREYKQSASVLCDEERLDRL